MEEEDIFGVDEDGVLTVCDLWRCLFKLIDVILQKSKQLNMIILVSYCRWSVSIDHGIMLYANSRHMTKIKPTSRVQS